mgnify:CR=1 FL=1
MIGRNQFMEHTSCRLRLAAIAEVGWSYDRKDFDDFKHRMNSLRKCYDAAGLNYATYFFEGKDE